MPNGERDWLIDRIEIEALALANADQTTRAIRWGRLLGFLEVGTRLGWWSRRSAERYADLAFHRMARGKAKKMLASRQRTVGRQ